MTVEAERRGTAIDEAEVQDRLVVGVAEGGHERAQIERDRGVDPVDLELRAGRDADQRELWPGDALLLRVRVADQA